MGDYQSRDTPIATENTFKHYYYIECFLFLYFIYAGSFMRQQSAFTKKN